ncbi:carbon-nitrogen hydrolase family protein [Roseobacter sp. HKCCD9010]|uniref:carbon-nitrogen hydrolase family protein n=1 Tax=unclassified Roseobacter TaxID=196798 RepID=UPI0014908D2E|nr:MULTISPECIES: carbon-nitrogen hydrolase family protein [unclassified Roseobacter]MBF9050146.1 carbon-nitrogen hydrolase family protein [Rhodobacterales bacterium HKCCD4356]NNV12389.1 carbon-nitrogen hydrolase family protein [Roseobacter sp. HKCCD7357]NNV16148.1 carbon-nitrogen hydrolase family protein [Roseobacter sp. HKCCD8768]NNV25608.1 carbon-nitrogen hydrolase family protein [Roseobacter sp. HKCCD8192]NNV29864.1 carbon-nitrogen hydrolase family protein [Roseobacter sp. HKCCD9061]
MKIIRSEIRPDGHESDRLAVGIAQIAPIWLNRAATLEKVMAATTEAADAGCDLVVFGEALVPGYPVWIERTDGARFNDPKQKAIYAHYVDQGVVIERGDLEPLCALAAERQIAIYLGVMERAPDRGGHSLYCTLVYIGPDGQIGSVHRKLHPTYEERLAWASGDGHGLRVHDLGPFRVGGLNCYENWLPLARSALYAQGESLHVSVWPGGLHNTCDLPVFIAKESRSYVIAASGLLRVSDLPEDTLARDEIVAAGGDVISNGGSTIVAPDGTVLVDPVVDEEALIVAEIDAGVVRGERQNLDQSGHYARPDILQLNVNRTRQRPVRFDD